MAVIDYLMQPEILMRTGITGRWIAGKEFGATNTSVLSNTAQPNVAVPRHFHEYEEIVLVEEGQIWVELGGARQLANAGQVVIIPPRMPHAWGNMGPKLSRILFIWPVLEPFAPGKSTYLEGVPPSVS